VVREEVGNFQDLAQFDRVSPFQQVSNFDRSAYKGPLGIDLAMDSSDVVEELRGSRIDFVARYYRDPTSSLPALSSQEARTLASLGLKIVAVWEQNSPDPENLSYSSGYSDAFSAYKQAKVIGQPAGSASYFAIDFNAHELEPANEGILSRYSSRFNGSKRRKSRIQSRRLRLRRCLRCDKASWVGEV
jgi:hypothetical protein